MPERSMTAAPNRLVIVAPNWLGDAVMALPLIADIRRQWTGAHLTVAGRGSVAAMFELVDDVDDVIRLHGAGGIGAVMSAEKNAAILGSGAFDTALLLPNSFVSAWIAYRARIAERWGFRADGRAPLLTRAIPRPRSTKLETEQVSEVGPVRRRFSKRGPRQTLHQAAYYQTLGAELGVVPGPMHGHVTVSGEARTHARALVTDAGLAPDAEFVAMAPGAAYGRAKQWLPERFAELAGILQGERSVRTVLVGSGVDARVCREIARRASPAAIDLCGRTDLPTLAGVFSEAVGVVANDSGAMHLAAAAGAHVVAVFGPTNEMKTAPLASRADALSATIVKTDVWCRPCMLRECPIDHRCMRGVTARAVFAELVR